ncbi:MAG: antitermination protein NusG [Acidimicrobiia bacterium]|nr:antitermination protein NusG [Acidimicrobiia bacterium]
MLADIQLFSDFGPNFLARWAHVLSGIAWIGLLYYFNFVQVPAFAELDAGVRNSAVDKLASRALWWFRWAAAATLFFGILLGLIAETGDGDGTFFTEKYFRSPAGVAISTGMLLGITMFLNVWLVIWPNQKKVIANARNVLSGGEADPGAAAAGRKALLASRQNMIFSLPMLLFMIGTVHFFPQSFTTDKDRGIYMAVSGLIWLALELNCLFNRGTNIGTWIYENHKRAIGASVVLAAVYYLLWEIIFQAA